MWEKGNTLEVSKENIPYDLLKLVSDSLLIITNSPNLTFMIFFLNLRVPFVPY